MRRSMVSGWVVILGIWFPAAAQQTTRPGDVQESLTALLEEASRRNPEILAAQHAWLAAQRVPSQVATLPDPEIFLQHQTVGSPRPFAGWTNSDFAYLGLGVTQRFPLPGKRVLRRQVAEAQAAALREHYEAVRRDVLSRLEQAYFRAARTRTLITILETQRALANEMVQAAETRYRSGGGSQQEVLQAQIEATRLLEELEALRLEEDRAQAELRYLLGRGQQEPAVPLAALTETPVQLDLSELLRWLPATDPRLREATEQLHGAASAVELARREFSPDFGLSFLWQHTAAPFRDMYMFTFTIDLPVHRRGRLVPALEQAQEEALAARERYLAELAREAQGLRESLDTVQRTEELLRVLRDGLLPQARAAFQAALAEYASGTADFQSLLSAFRSLLTAQQQQVEATVAHETALARIEQLTGVHLVSGARVQGGRP